MKTDLAVVTKRNHGSVRGYESEPGNEAQTQKSEERDREYRRQ